MDRETDKRIGIVTFHNAINYGVHLQAFSLVHVLGELGYKAEVIDYRKKVEKKGFWKRIKNLLLNFYSIGKNRIYQMSEPQKMRRELFAEFDKKYLNLTEYCSTFEATQNISSQYKAVVCGSDQIWNPAYTEGNRFYFGEMVEETRRIAYAPSMGVKVFPEVYRNVYQKRLNKIPYLSIREEAGQQIVKDLTGRNCKVVVDPTLLVKRETWEALLSEINIEYAENSYVLCYILGNQKIIDEIGSIGEKNGYTVLNISQHARTGKQKNVIDVYPSIEEFLALYKGAKYIITDSYHGTMFSLIFQKDFYALSRRDTKMDLSSRIETVLKRIGLEKRFIYDVAQIDILDTNIVYDRPNDILKQWTEESMTFLVESLKQAVGEI